MTPPSLGPLAEEEPPPPINSNHDLPLPFTVPHGVKKESPQSPVSKKNMATSHVSHAVARLKYPQASEGIGSPLNLPSKSRKGLQPKAYTHTSDNPPASDISTSLPENVSHRQKIRSSIANIWNQTQTEFSDDDAKEAKNSMTETYQSQLLFPNTMSPVISDSSTIPPRAQSGSLSASIARETRKLSTSSQRSRSESFIDCQEDPLTGFILPPPSASPSFPLSLSSSTPPTTDTLKEIDLFGREPKDYYVALTPDSASQVEVAPIVPLDSARSILTSESSATEDDFEHDRKVNAAVQVTLDEYNETPLPNEMKSNSSFNQMRDEMNNILQSESSELLERMVLQAAVETAFSYQTVNTLGGKRKDVFKACHQV